MRRHSKIAPRKWNQMSWNRDWKNVTYNQIANWTLPACTMMETVMDIAEVMRKCTFNLVVKSTETEIHQDESLGCWSEASVFSSTYSPWFTSTTSRQRNRPSTWIGMSKLSQLETTPLSLTLTRRPTFTGRIIIKTKRVCCPSVLSSSCSFRTRLNLDCKNLKTLDLKILIKWQMRTNAE